ncbi:MAG: ferritin family protein [Kiritimatiellota bacterium]|nr:ferritin family protein [Kiritimatiellota bacterium]
MITKKDYTNHLLQMVRLEEQMEAIYDTLKTQMHHAKYKALFNKLAKDERGHAALIHTLIQLFSEKAP